jgi:hypothetical protein
MHDGPRQVGNLALASTVVPHLARRDRSGHVGILLLSLSSSGGAVGLGQPSVSDSVWFKARPLSGRWPGLKC